MTKYFADQNQLSFLYESGTYANVSGTRQWIGLVQEHSVDESTNNISVRYQGSTDRNVDTFVNGNLDYTGTFTYYPQDWKFLGIAIGSNSETASAGSHVFTESNSDDSNYAIADQSLSSFTLEDTKDNGTAGSNFIRTLNGCMIDSYSITCTQGELISCEVGYMAQNMTFTSGAITAVGITTTAPYKFDDIQLQIPSGTVIDNTTEATVTVNNNLEPGHYLNGSRVIQEPLPQNRDYELAATITMDADNAKTFYENYFLGGSVFNGMLQAVGAPGSLFLVMSGCKVTDMETPSPVEGIHEQSITIVPQHVSATVEDATADYNAW
ncbi:MAG: phage tail tube protein [Candidatus Heimdallarchaeaceae archaeon]